MISPKPAGTSLESPSATDPTSKKSETNEVGVAGAEESENKPGVARQSGRRVAAFNALKWVAVGLIVALSINVAFDLLSGNLFRMRSSEPSPAAFQEWRLASADHEIIAAAVAACSKIFNLTAQPAYI
jgi:hypothetical protein